MALPSYHVQNFVHDSRFPYALYWDFCKKLGELLVLRRSIKILSKRSEIDYLKNKPAQSNSQLNMPDVAHEIKISIDRLFLLILFMCITICMTEGERKVF